MHLIITEKHSTAKRIANILANNKPIKNRVNGVDTYEFDDKVVIGLSGHIVNLDFPPEYNNWQKVESRDLIYADVIKIPTQKKIVSALKKLAKNADHATIATDFDREGELIGVEALNIILEVNKNIKVDRVRYSAITPIEIKNSFSNPKKIDFNLADAGESRQIIDLLWGSSLTRFISLSSGRLGNQFLSVGRVQSPTLALLVYREKERDAFVPKPYWEIYALVQSTNLAPNELKNNNTFIAKHIKGRFFDKKEAEDILNRLNNTGIATLVGTVKELKKDKKIDKPPTPFNTTEFLSAASSIGFSASNAMRIAESLYINGFISYPRTDNTVYPSTLDTRGIIESFKDSVFREYAMELLKKKELIPTRGKKESTDHPPIHPVSVAVPKGGTSVKSALKEEEWKVYELVTRRFFATFADAAIWETMKVLIEINGEDFKANGRCLIEKGWRWYYPYRAIEDKILPKLEKGVQVQVLKIDLVSKETQPPQRYGQGRLIKKMEELGLGTKSTRHDTISKLYSRAYVHGNPLQPTKIAYSVTDTLSKYAEKITKPDMTRALEQDMDKIANGSLKKEKVIELSRSMLNEVFDALEKNKEEISKELREGLREDKIVGTCPECTSELIIRSSRKGRFIGCTGYPDCNFSLPLPKCGQIIVLESSCEEHKIKKIQIIKKGKGKPWNLGCPFCNFIEWQKTDRMKKKLTDITGIGEATSKKLTDIGIKSVKDFVDSNAKELSEKLHTSENRIKKWQKNAIYKEVEE
ncbi:MAG TPA: DNA topoisomerase I [Methanosarcinales archaeon]|nr:DNA topoisomerase I [Methanosarcinales archaeon]